MNDQNADFANALNCRREISKFAASIGGCDLSTNHSPFLFDSTNYPITTTWDTFDDSLKGLLDPLQIEFVWANISAAETIEPKGLSPTMLSNLWCISDKLAEGAIDQNTQLCWNNADNALSQQFTKNDRILRYKRIQSKSYSEFSYTSVYDRFL